MTTSVKYSGTWTGNPPPRHSAARVCASRVIELSGMNSFSLLFSSLLLRLSCSTSVEGPFDGCSVSKRLTSLRFWPLFTPASEHFFLFSSYFFRSSSCRRFTRFEGSRGFGTKNLARIIAAAFGEHFLPMRLAAFSGSAGIPSSIQDRSSARRYQHSSAAESSSTPDELSASDAYHRYAGGFFGNISPFQRRALVYVLPRSSAAIQPPLDGRA